MKKIVKVKPNSKRQEIIEQPDGSLLVYLKSPPVDGKGNQELIKILAKQYGVARSQVTIKSGLSAKNKLVEILLT
ncbi:MULTISPECIES: DUF167 domain-containing protein [unclassified Spirulina]|uniref:DUF167 domain-containing protein n=1 Tax=unclassified Spirulina TaxID=2684457 RepID=UPI001950401B|nr:MULTISPECIES: DUF167 domain-containing protein [Spirulina]MEA5469612.1 DUF167 domain-containing protein [Spirulina sp. 06S082]